MKIRAQHSNRPDDANEEIIRRRLDVYQKDTKPVLDFYGASLISNVDAVGLPGEILMNVLDTIIPAARGVIGNPFGA
jgi:adenylate kinase